MVERVTVGEAEVEIRETADGFEAVEVTQSFEDYLRENVFVHGWYSVWDHSVPFGDIGVAENDRGGGYVMEADVHEAIEDPNVHIKGVDDGRLLLRDDRWP